MDVFFDHFGCKVELTFQENQFKEETRHVLVICQLGDEWLLTNHKERGLEFPGGKIEPGETLEEGARREVFEETGAYLSDLLKIGEYRVTDEKGSFVKAVFYGKAKQLEKKAGYMETNGPVLIKGDLLKMRFQDDYSFIMKDDVIKKCIHMLQAGHMPYLAQKNGEKQDLT